MSSDRRANTSRNRLVLAGIVALVVAVAALAIFQNRRTEVARRAAERADRVERAQEESGTERDAERERAAQREQQWIATQQREQAEREAPVEADRNLDQRRRRAREQDRQDREQQLAEQERLAAEREKEEEERRRAAELSAPREAAEQAEREEGRKRSDDEPAQARVEQLPADADLDDTPDVDTDSSIDDVSDERGWSVKGDLRPIIQYENEEGRDGETTRDGNVGARLRLQAVWGITKGLELPHQGFLGPTGYDDG